MRRRFRSASARRGRSDTGELMRVSIATKWRSLLRLLLRCSQNLRTYLHFPGAPLTHSNPHHERRWLILGVIAIAQLMVVLDATIVNIALPSAQRDLGFSDGDRQWLITAYALAFGSLLLIGGGAAAPFVPKRPVVARLPCF